MMLSNSQYCNTVSSFDFDDLFSLPIDFQSDEEYNHYSNSDDEIIEHEMKFSSEIAQCQSQTSSAETFISNLICGVCGAPATGYNFDQITCESCKAFFRRNALRHMPDLKCRFSGSCVIDVHTRRQCTYCRLKKCFDIKMRKDWIRTDEETKLRQLQKLIKQQRKLNNLTTDPQPLVNLPIVARKKKRIMVKPLTVVNLLLTGTYFSVNRHLSDNDHVLLNNITHAYKLGADQADLSFIAKYTSSASLSQFINDTTVMHSSLIYYFKGVPEFKQLAIDDQVLLIKSNFINIIHLHHVIVENFEESPHIGGHMSKWISEDFHHQMSRTRRYFDRFMKYPLVLKLTLIIFVFSTNLSTTCDISRFDEFQDTKKLWECQNYYTALLWRYLNHLYEEKEAIKAIEIIVMQILHYQILMITLDDCVRKTSKHAQFHSLIQSIFGLS